MQNNNALGVHRNVTTTIITTTLLSNHYKNSIITLLYR